MSIPAILIGSESSDHVVIAVTRREFADATDYWDGNWIYASVRVNVGSFRGEYEALLRTDEIASFRDGLTRLHAELKGAATFQSMEQWLRIHVEGDGLGHFTAKCEARDQPGIGNTLQFELRFDQTDLPPMLASLDAVLTAFPVIGAP